MLSPPFYNPSKRPVWPLLLLSLSQCTTVFISPQWWFVLSVRPGVLEGFSQCSHSTLRFHQSLHTCTSEGISLQTLAPCPSRRLLLLIGGGFDSSSLAPKLGSLCTWALGMGPFQCSCFSPHGNQTFPCFWGSKNSSLWSPCPTLIFLVSIQGKPMEKSLEKTVNSPHEPGFQLS